MSSNRIQLAMIIAEELKKCSKEELKEILTQYRAQYPNLYEKLLWQTIIRIETKEKLKRHLIAIQELRAANIKMDKKKGVLKNTNKWSWSFKQHIASFLDIKEYAVWSRLNRDHYLNIKPSIKAITIDAATLHDWAINFNVKRYSLHLLSGMTELTVDYLGANNENDLGFCLNSTNLFGEFRELVANIEKFVIIDDREARFVQNIAKSGALKKFTKLKTLEIHIEPQFWTIKRQRKDMIELECNELERLVLSKVAKRINLNKYSKSLVLLDEEITNNQWQDLWNNDEKVTELTIINGISILYYDPETVLNDLNGNDTIDWDLNNCEIKTLNLIKIEAREVLLLSNAFESTWIAGSMLSLQSLTLDFRNISLWDSSLWSIFDPHCVLTFSQRILGIISKSKIKTVNINCAFASCQTNSAMWQNFRMYFANILYSYLLSTNFNGKLNVTVSLRYNQQRTKLMNVVYQSPNRNNKEEKQKWFNQYCSSVQLNPPLIPTPNDKDMDAMIEKYTK